MAKYIAPIQPLILTVADAKPTIPSPSTIMPDDIRFNKQSDIMVGQLAYNVIDDLWYYRNSSAIKKLTGSTVLDVNDVEVWRNDKIYQAGNTFVSYVNPASGDPQFQTAAIYRCITTTVAGESPESAPAKWELQGAQIDDSQVSFLDLSDTPTSYTGLANKYVVVNETEDGLTFIDAPESETITLDTVEVWDVNTAYTAGNTFVSYVNVSSPDPQFQAEAIYRCDVNTVAGESPETDPAKWIFQGTQVEISSGNTSNTIVNTLSTLQAITGYDNTDSVFVISEKSWYKFNSSDDSGIKANDYDAVDNPGSWKSFYSIESVDMLWEPDTGTAATTEHPRWDDSGDPNVYGTDNFGFNALPSATRNPEGSFAGLGEFMGIWSIRNFPSDNSQFFLGFNDSSAYLFTTGSDFTKGNAIRLVRPYTVSDGSKIDGRILTNAFTDFDGNNYNGTIIGDQVWLTSNLKTTSYTDGTPIPTGYSDVDWSNLTTGAYAVYDYTLVTGIDSEAEMITAYGLLYNWYAVTNASGLGDANWHVPSDAEFNQLTSYIINNYPSIDNTNVGDSLKSVRQVNSPFEADSDLYIRPIDGKKVKVEHIEGSGATDWDGLSDTFDKLGNAGKLPKVSDDELSIEPTPFDYTQIVQVADIDMTDVAVGESKILLAQKQSDGSAAFEGAVAQVDKIGPPGLDTLLGPDQSWNGDEITLSGDNSMYVLGQNSQEFYNDEDWFLCISHTSTSATWKRNRGQDCLNIGEATADAIITELETETGWNTIANFKQITTKSKKGSWFRRDTGGYLYMCIDTSNGWARIGTPDTFDLEISSASHPTLTTNLAAHDFVTNGWYDETSDVANEVAEQGQLYIDYTNENIYRRLQNNMWAKIL